MSTTAIVIMIVILVVAYLALRLIAAGGRVLEYFDNAVKAYVWLEDEEAGLAALAAAKTASSEHRAKMVAHLRVASAGLEYWIAKVPEFRRAIERVDKFAAAISEKVWTTRDAAEAQSQLEKVSPDYSDGLKKSNPSVFVIRYPALFSAKNVFEEVQAAATIKHSEVERGVEVMEQLKKLEGFQGKETQRTLNEGIEQAKRDLGES